MNSEKNVLTYVNLENKEISTSNFPPLQEKMGENMVFIVADSLTEKIRMMSQGHRLDKVKKKIII